MTAFQQLCSDRRRRRLPARRLNGIDYLEVEPGGTTIRVACFLPATALTPGQVVIEGGERVHPAVVNATATGSTLVVTVDRTGDCSTYTLRLHKAGGTNAAPDGFDPSLSWIDFAFDPDGDPELDCRAAAECPPEAHDEPDIDYRARDYASFRRLMLDRLSAVIPSWAERSPADAGIALVELLAYLGDELTYAQDAVATEAYLSTARRRVSIRRHARLLDYPVHEGCNARAWVQLQVRDGAPDFVLPAGTLVLSGSPGAPATAAPDPVALARLVIREQPAVFQTMHDCPLQAAANRLSFHTWGDADCCLPAGATAASLAATPGLALAAGDLLLLEEVAGSDPAAPDVVDPTRRHVVRLTAVEPLRDGEAGTDVLQVAWAAADALPFPLCLSLSTEGAPPVEVAVAYGNVALADHGLPVDGHLAPLLGVSLLDRDRPSGGRPYRPRLGAAPIAFADPLPGPRTPAAACMRRDARASAPAIALTDGVRTWSWRPDLLGSDRFAADFTAEVDDGGVASLRFGDGELGRAPDPGRPMVATCRVGGGASGNVGAEALTRVALASGDVIGVRNPLPAAGGQDPEPVEQVRQLAPQAFRTQLRAVTEADYAEVAQRRPDVQRASAQFRWTGSWYTAFVTIDPAGRTDLDEQTRTDVAGYLDGFRLAGWDVEVEPPAPVPVELAITACAAPGHLPSHVRAALQTAFSNRPLPGGGRGFFHPDSWTFGQPLYLSQVYRAALAVPGVQSVTIDVLRRLGQPGTSAIASGRLQVGRFEVVRCDSDPSAPDRGRARVEVRA